MELSIAIGEHKQVSERALKGGDVDRRWVLHSHVALVPARSVEPGRVGVSKTANSWLRRHVAVVAINKVVYVGCAREVVHGRVEAVR